MSAQTCATCKHFRLARLAGDGLSSFGSCWRYPPSRNDTEVALSGVCGEHSPADTGPR